MLSVYEVEIFSISSGGVVCVRSSDVVIVCVRSSDVVIVCVRSSDVVWSQEVTSVFQFMIKCYEMKGCNILINNVEIARRSCLV